MIQVIKTGEECWQLTRVDALWKNAHEYTTIARVRRDGAMYYVDLAVWKEESFTWVRQPRGYLIPRAAFKAAVEASQKEAVMQ